MLIAMLLVLTPYHWHLYLSWWLPALALCLDLLLPHPPFPPHPVRGIGKIIRLAEWPLLKIKSGKGQAFMGFLASILLAMGALWVVGFLMIMPHPLGLVFGVYISYAGLGLGGLLRDGAKTLDAIENGTLEEARRAVSTLVSQGVSQLDEDIALMDKSDLLRRLAESLSENFCNAFVGPFFWLIILGPPGLWVYKTVNTLDSMWGCKTAPWTYLGKAPRKMEDTLSFFPSRIAAFFLAASGKLTGCPVNKKQWKLAQAQAKTMESPNCGYPMAVAAWAHKARMGGPTLSCACADDSKNKPVLGPVRAYSKKPDDGLWTEQKIRDLLRHLKMAGLVAGGTFCGIGVFNGIVRLLFSLL